MLKNNLIISSIQRSLHLLPASFNKKFIWILFLTLINSILDLTGLATILPVFGIILTDNFLIKYPLFQQFYDLFSFSSENYFVIFLCCIILCILVIKNALGVLINRKQSQFSWETFQKISLKMYDVAYQRGFLFFNGENSNKILNEIVGVPRIFSQSVLQQLIYFLNELIILVLITITLFIYNPFIFLLLGCIVAPIFFVFYQTTKKKINELGERINQLSPLINKPIFDTVFGYIDVTITGTEHHFRKQFKTAVSELKEVQVTNTTMGLLPSRIIEVCIFLAVILMMLYGMFYFDDKEQIIALISIFGLSAYRAIPTINRMMLAIMSIEGQKFTFDIIETYFNTTIEKNNQKKITFNETISFQNLTFKYPNTDQKVLDDISGTIQKGQIIGIIGESGSGKTTFANILLRLLTETSGKIILDGTQSLTSEYEKDWKKKIGYVRQDVFLVDSTLAENIAFGIPKEEIDDEKIHQVIESTALTDVVNNLDNGIYSVIGERGVKLSGGQRQRIGIARALYNDAEVLVFDEATSALDTKTEEEITNAIQRLSNSNLTMFIIAHRITTLKYCNKIISFANGKIEKEYSYSEIIDNHH